MQFWKKTVCGLTAAAAIGFAGASANAVSINSLNDTFSYDFTGFDGNGDPTDWSTFDVSNTSNWQGSGSGTSTAGGKYSFGDTGSGPTFEGSLGFLPSSTRAIIAAIEFTNNTGSVIDEIDISYVAEQWRRADGGRINGWEVEYDIDGSPQGTIAGLTYSASNVGATGGGPISATALSASLTGLGLADGSDLQINFFGDNGTGSGSRQGVAIDDFTLTVVPEPASVILLGLGAAALLGRRKRNS